MSIVTTSGTCWSTEDEGPENYFRCRIFRSAFSALPCSCFYSNFTARQTDDTENGDDVGNNLPSVVGVFLDEVSEDVDEVDVSGH